MWNSVLNFSTHIFAISSFRLGFSALKQSLIYNNFNSVLMKTNSFCTIRPERHQMLFCLWETPLCAEALSLLVYGLWLCRIFIGGLFGESQYVPCQVFKAAKPVLGNFKSRHTWGCPSLLILEPQKQIFFFSLTNHMAHQAFVHKNYTCAQTLYVLVCPVTSGPGAAVHFTFWHAALANTEQNFSLWQIRTIFWWLHQLLVSLRLHDYYRNSFPSIHRRGFT